MRGTQQHDAADALGRRCDAGVRTADDGARIDVAGMGGDNRLGYGRAPGAGFRSRKMAGDDDLQLVGPRRIEGAGDEALADGGAPPAAMLAHPVKKDHEG